MPQSLADGARLETGDKPPPAHPPVHANRFNHLRLVARQLNPTVRLGRVEFTFGGHVWGIFIFALTGIQPLPANARFDVLVLVLLVYAAAQAGRVVHELGHVGVGLLCGRHLLRIRITASVMAVWFPDDDSVRSIRLTCLAGGISQAVFGVALLLFATAVGANGPLGLRQSLEIVGAMHIGAIGNLLPLSKMDGEYVWGIALRTRPNWLAYAPSVLCLFLAVALICPQLPDPQLQEILAVLEHPIVVTTLLLLLAAGLPLIPRLNLPTEAMPASAGAGLTTDLQHGRPEPR
jgi:hypothetical protein